MSERLAFRCLLSAAASTVMAAALLGVLGASQLSVGVLVGGAWTLLNLWCLAQLLRSWLGSQRSSWRAIGWLVAKFPLLYIGVLLCLRHPAVSPFGFGIGFTIALVAALSVFAMQARQPVMARADGR